MKPRMHPQSLMMSAGYDPASAQHAVKLPLYLTSTFEFESAEEGKAFFQAAYGNNETAEGDEPGYIYSRIDNPNLHVLEKRLCLWDETEDCAVFGSGMAAISTTLLELLKPGDVLLYGSPVYGGTAHFIADYLPKNGIECIRFNAQHTMEEVMHLLIDSGKSSRLKCIFLETPANPTNDIFDIAMCREIADHFSKPDEPVQVVVDNTFMGPIWSHPVRHGADLVVYSATKYIGGHSDLIAGAVLGSREMIGRIKELRTFFGSMPSPHTCWMLTRSLETLKVRMEAQMENARLVAGYLEHHPFVEKVHYLGLIPEDSKQYPLYRKQYSSPGAMISFDIHGGEEEAFRFMNGLQLFKLAVSLGSTESLVQHPATMTHAGIPADERNEMGVTDKMVRLSIGLEHADDLIRDIEQAMDIVAFSSFQDVDNSRVTIQVHES